MSETFHIKNVDPEALNSERQRVLELLTACLPSEHVHEVGSTAVPGLLGKQDLDFLVLVPAKDFLSTRSVLDQRFSRNPAQLSNDVYQGYMVASDFDVAIQLTIKGGPHDSFLDFLARLRASASLRAAYNQLKQSFDGRDMDEYREAKGAFIHKVLSANED